MIPDYPFGRGNLSSLQLPFSFPLPSFSPSFLSLFSLEVGPLTTAKGPGRAL